MYRFVDDLTDEFENGGYEEIENKLSNYINLAETFIIENNYVDKDWRDEYSIHYSKTSYEGVAKFATRVHMVSEKIDEISQVNNDNYLGYFVLRPLPVNKLIKIVVNPIKSAFGVDKNEKLYLAMCTFEAHLGGLQHPLIIKTFPFYQQDSMVTSCAHANMRMITEYLHRKFGFNRSSISDFILHTPPWYGRPIPTRGLTIEQMTQILNNLGYNVSITKTDTHHSYYSVENLIERIDAYLESKLPTIIGFNGHVVVVVGHTLDKNNNKDYIIYDDSGYHITETFKKQPSFVARVSGDELVNALKKAEEPIIALNVEFSRMYFPLESVDILCNLIIRNYYMNNTPLKNLIAKRRILLVDSNEFKMFCSRRNVFAFNEISLPHYIWLVELYDKSGDILCELIIDASAHKYDFIGSLVALWFKDGWIKFLNRFLQKNIPKEHLKVDKGPEVYPNLDEVAGQR